MKKARGRPSDALRVEYKRSDFGEVVRGKYAPRVAASCNVVVLEPQVARVFPNERAVNEALRSLIRVAEASARLTRRSRRVARRGAAA
jgi:hypothetical protein